MNYIPRKKILVEKYSMEIEAEEFLNDILELCYTISFVHNIQARIINGHPTKDKQCELTYLIVKDDDIRLNNNIFIVLMHDIGSDSLLIVVERGFINFLLSYNLDYSLIGQTILNYFSRKTTLKVGIYDTNLETTYKKILEEYLKI